MRSGHITYYIMKKSIWNIFHDSVTIKQLGVKYYK